jgi:hypothetical protein
MDRLCQHGNCSNYDTPFSVNGSGYRTRFCSWLHAGQWAIRQAKTVDHSNPYAVALIQRAENLLEEADRALRHDIKEG